MSTETPTTADLRPTDRSRPLRVLIGVSDDDPSDDAVRFARRHLPADAEVTVLSVAGVTAGPAGPLGIGGDQPYPRRQQAEQIAAEAADRLPHATDESVESGDPAATICAVAEADDMDLIVVGTHDRSLWERLWYGSVAQHVAMHAPCSVLIVR